MARPQVEEGYTRLANELLEAMTQVSLPGYAWQVWLAVVRKTYGWQKAQDWISSGQLVALTGLHRRTVFKALRLLKDNGMIVRENGVTGMQKDYSQWVLGVPGAPRGVPPQALCPDRHYAPTGTGGVPPQALEEVPVRAYTKEKKEKKERERPKGKLRLPPKPAGPPTRSPDQLPQAVEVYANLTGKLPRHGTLQYKAIVETVGSDQAALAKWQKVIEAWLLSDYKPTNIRGMLEWFATGKVGQQVLDATPAEDQAKITPQIEAYYKQLKATQGG